MQLIIPILSGFAGNDPSYRPGPESRSNTIEPDTGLGRYDAMSFPEIASLNSRQYHFKMSRSCLEIIPYL